MCSTADNHEGEPTDLEADDRSELPRRDVLVGMAALPIAGLLPRAGARTHGVQVATAGVVRSALHVHHVLLRGRQRPDGSGVQHDARQHGVTGRDLGHAGSGLVLLHRSRSPDGWRRCRDDDQALLRP